MLWLLPVAAFFLNPAVACSSADSEAEYQYGESELRAAVEGIWAVQWNAPDGTPTTLRVRLLQATQASSTAISSPLDEPAAPSSSYAGSFPSLVRPAFACGNRTLIKAANACADTTEMPLAVSFEGGDEAFRGQRLSGRFVVMSLVFQSGELQLSLGDKVVTARVGADGTVESAATTGNTAVSLARLETPPLD